jgi:hypothetical protein
VSPPKPRDINPPPLPTVGNSSVHHPLPDREARTKFRKLFEEVFAAQLKDRSPASRRKFAQQMLAEAAKLAGGSPDHFVLVTGALQAASEGQNLRLCFLAAKMLSQNYEVDELATEVDTATKSLASSTTGFFTVGNIELLLSLGDQLAARDDFSTISRVESLLQRGISAISDPELATEVKNHIRDMATLRELSAKMASAQAKLKASPSDPATNLLVGSYLCFQRGQWEKGLPLLAKSSDADLKSCASIEAAQPTAPDDILKLADRWYGIATKLAARDRPGAMLHAAVLYSTALPNLTGLQKLAIEKRLSEMPPLRRLRRVDLLELFDPATSIVKGSWRMADQGLTTESNESSRIDFSYEPPEEYDFRIAFTLSHVEGAIAQICSHNSHPFMYQLGGWDNTVAAYEVVNGVPGSRNPSARRKDRWLTKGVHYVSVVKVRRDRIESYLDGQLVTSLKTDYTDMTLDPSWQLSHSSAIGIGAYKDTVLFESAEIIEITGEGKQPAP